MNNKFNFYSTALLIMLLILLLVSITYTSIVDGKIFQCVEDNRPDMVICNDSGAKYG